MTRFALFIREITLTDFRGIREGSITGLGEINVFVGRNNSGKSSILEALYLLRVPLGPQSELGDRGALAWLLQRRARRTGLDARALSRHYDEATPLTISCVFDGLNVTMTAKCSEGNIEFEYLEATSRFSMLSGNSDMGSEVTIRSGGIVKQSVSLGFRGTNPLLSLDFGKIGGQIPSLDAKSVSSCKEFFQYIQCVVLVDEEFVSQTESIEDAFWQRILAKRVDKRLHQILNDTYGTNIENFTLSPYPLPPRPRSSDRRGHRLSAALEDFSQYVDDYGEGVRNSLASFIIASQLHDTALLLEEPEIHQHPAALRLFLTALCKIVHENRLQLFVTTHSLEAMNCLARIEGTVIFHLELDSSGKLKARKVESADARVLNDLGVDLHFSADYLIVEGDCDRIFWETASRQLTGKSIANLSYRLVQAAKDQQKDTVAALVWLGGTIRVLRDYDRDKNVSEIVKGYSDSLTGRFKDCKIDGESITIDSTGAKVIVIPQGLPDDNDLAGVGVRNHSVEDYCLKLLALDDNVRSWAGIDLKQLAKDAENALRNIKGPKLDSSKLLLGALALKKGMTDKEIIREIVLRSAPEKLKESLGESYNILLGGF